jgi:hypothetical protein
MWLIFKLSQRRGEPIRSNPKDMEMASQRVTSLLDRAQRRLRHFVFINEATPWKRYDQAISLTITK